MEITASLMGKVAAEGVFFSFYPEYGGAVARKLFRSGERGRWKRSLPAAMLQERSQGKRVYSFLRRVCGAVGSEVI